MIDVDDREREVLAEAARVVGEELATAQMEALLLRVLPTALDVVLHGMSKAFEREIVGLHNRLDRMERDLNEALARERRRTHPNRRDT